MLLLAVGQIGGILAEPGGECCALRLGEVQIALRLVERARQLSNPVGFCRLGDRELALRRLAQRIDAGLRGGEFVVQPGQCILELGICQLGALGRGLLGASDPLEMDITDGAIRQGGNADRRRGA